MDCSFPGTIDLDQALEYFANNDQACELIDEEFATRGLKDIGASFRSKSLPGPLREEVEGFLEESILNSSEIVWSGQTFDEHDEENEDAAWPVYVEGFCGLYWIFSPEQEKVGYFLEAEKAIDWCHLNWTNLDGDYSLD